MANRLAEETSPYLLQHRDNPVDWYPWGEDALSRARDEDRPILLSVGYASCHWCHVMERESFEDPETAAYMNEHFVCVKVDREERPDVDALYMEAVQAMTGHGGWPMTVFLGPDQVPFFGGTYFPPEAGRGMPSFRQVMEAVVDAFENRRDEIRTSAGRTRDQLAAVARIEPSKEPLQPGLLSEAVAGLRARADLEHGGFGGAPKFPPASALEFLLSRDPDQAGDIPALTLDAMAQGALQDHGEGGFHRYTVNADWTEPHFEKMLYDNALLARAYLHGWQKLGHERYREICERTLDWELHDMRGPEGGFYAAVNHELDDGFDDKRITAWNALMIAALAEAGAVLGRDDYLTAAIACAEFVERDLRGADGRLLRTYKDGQARIPAYLEDHAFLLEALITLFETSCEPRWYEAAHNLAATIIARFADPEKGGFFTTADDGEQLIARRKDLQDHPIPSGNSAAAYGLLRLWILSGEDAYREQALGALRLLGTAAARHPDAFGHALQAMALYNDPDSYPFPRCPIPPRGSFDSPPARSGRRSV
jgi:uncharacterized protein YyaL (SSP411 family)